jgi:hypothetical protein
MIIDNSKFIITNEIQANRYDVNVVTDLTGSPAVFKIEQNGNLIFFSNYSSLSISEDSVNDIVNIISEGFVGQFSANNVNGWASTNGFITGLLTSITTSV